MKKKQKQYNTVVARKSALDLATMPERSNHDGTVQLGDIVTRRPVTFSLPGGEDQQIKGRVVWIHPLGRFHVVEFGEGGRSVCESFLGVDI